MPGAIIKLSGWIRAMAGPFAYVLPMGLPLLIGSELIDPWVARQDWGGWSRLVFWFLYTGISTGLTFAATIMAVQAIEKRQHPPRR